MCDQEIRESSIRKMSARSYWKYKGLFSELYGEFSTLSYSTLFIFKRFWLCKSDIFFLVYNSVIESRKTPCCWTFWEENFIYQGGRLHTGRNFRFLQQPHNCWRESLCYNTECTLAAVLYVWAGTIDVHLIGPLYSATT